MSRTSSIFWRIRPIRPPRRFHAALLPAALLMIAPLPAAAPADPDRGLTRPAALDASAPAGPERHVPIALGVRERALLKHGMPLHVHPAFGVPTFAWAAPEAPLSRRGAGKVEPGEAGRAARAHMSRFAILYRMEAADFAALETGPVHDTGRGAIVVPLRPRVEGLEIFREEIRLAMDRDLHPVALSGFTVGNREALARGGTPRFVLGAAAAAAIALGDLIGREIAAADLRPAGAGAGGYRLFTLDRESAASAGIALPDPARAKKVLFRLVDRLEPAFYIEVSAGEAGSTDSDRYAYVVSAADGRLLFRNDQTVDDVFAYRVWADPVSFIPDDGPHGTSPTPHPTGNPDSFVPPFVSPVLVSLQNGPLSTNDPWLAPGATATAGNNTDAYADIVSPDGFSAGDLRAGTTSANTFDRTYDTSLSPASSALQRMAAITQLFYDINYLHDWFYDAGFDEASGNAQSDNYGRGGVAGDPLRAEAQDFSGRNNANMSTPSDGFSPRMQMYVFDGIGRRSLTVDAPPAIAGVYAVGNALFGPTAFTTSTQVVLVDDGSAATTDACQTPFVNAAAISGRIALVDRGTCTFVTKVKNAQLNGAIGVLVANNTTTGVISMSGTDATITIPSQFISQNDGTTIKAQLGAGVDATLWREAATDRDGTIDNQIVAHEWGHYISNRLVGDASGLSNQQGRAMGEGWGDFHSMLLTVRPEDATAPAGADFTGVYGMAGYVLFGGNNNGGWNNAHYFGIRRYPYSIDMTKSPLTFRHISNGVALPPGVPVEGDTTGVNNSEVHNAGEVWASMLWECYAALLRDTGRLSFEEARSRMIDYLVAGYKMTPAAPTYLEARDALLGAAYAGDPADYALFWRAFARRGAGLDAVAPDRFSTTLTGVVESFVSGGDLAFESAVMDDSVGSCDNDGVLDAGESGLLTITLRNTGEMTLSDSTATITAMDPDIVFPGGPTVIFPPSSPFGTTTASIEVRLAAAGPSIEVQQFSIAFDDPGLAVPGPVAVSYATRAQMDEVPQQSAVDDVEASSTSWTPDGAGGFHPTRGWSRVESSPTQHWWYGPDPSTVSDQWIVSPPLQVAPAGSFTITFQHRHSFEFSGTTYYDGGVVEISSNGGASWADIGASASPGYTGTIAAGGSNPLEGRTAWTAVSPGYPSFTPVTIDLGTTRAGQSVMVRFRVGTDVGVGAPGWEVDDIAFGNITNLPFAVVVDEQDACPDSDADGRPDMVDCAPLDGAAWASPTAATDMLFAADAVTMAWSPPANAGGSTPRYDVIRSAAASSFNPAVCVETDDADLMASDSAVPMPGTVHYYLARSRNVCGSSLGVSSSGVPRTGAPCP